MRHLDGQVRRLAAVLLAVGVVAGMTVLAGLAAVLVQVEAPARLVVVDTDAGADDAFAILTILRAEEMGIDNEWSAGVPRLLAVTCVQGNTGVLNVTKNVFATLDTAGRLDIPVYVGASVPLLPPRPEYTFFFGQDGFGDFLPPGPPLGNPEPEAAAVALVSLAREHRGQLTLLCIGPLTNVALAVRLDSGFLDNLQSIYILGGAAHGNGNAKPGAEFNFWMDPDAAEVVLDAISPGKTPAFLLPWETALDAEVPLAWRRSVLGSAATRAMAFLNLAEAVALRRADTNQWVTGDGLLASLLVDGRVARPGGAVRVSVLGGPGPARGVSLADHSNTTGLPANAVLIERPDTAAFQRLLLKLLAS